MNGDSKILLRYLGNVWNDYEKIYPEDEYFKELDDGARVWKVFNDESERIDAEMVDGWTSTLDTLFIFVGECFLYNFYSLYYIGRSLLRGRRYLTAQSLQQDYSAVTASLLTEMVILQRVTASGGNIIAVPRSDLNYTSAFTSSSRDVWLNSLWFASLALTLSVALMAGLIKQWLHYYLADITGANPKVRALTRQFRYKGLIQWGVPPVIESLPVLMNTSLFLFFIGLVLFTLDLSGTVGIRWFLVGITALLFTIYVGSSLVPVWKPQCPYKTSLSKLYNGLVKATWYLVRKLSFGDEEQDPLASSSSKEDAESRFKHYSTRIKRWVNEILSHGSSLKTAESEIVRDLGIRLTQDVITEMGLNSTNPSVSAVALQSLAASHASEMHPVSLGLSDSLIEKLRDSFRVCFQHGSDPWNYLITSDPPAVERYSRAMLLFPSHIKGWLGDWHRMLSFSPPDSLGTAALLTSAASRFRIWEDMKLGIRFILDLPPMEVSKAIPWHHHQFINAVEAAWPDLYSTDEQEQLLVTLVRRLSNPFNALTLQDDMLIRCLYSCRTKLDVIEPLKEQASDKELNLETSADIRTRSRETLLQFIILLPDIYDCAFSLGTEEQDQVLLYLSSMNIWEETDGVHMNWDGHRLNFEAEFFSCVEPLIKLLNRVAASWESWNGNVLLRLWVITRLHDVLWFCGKCGEEVRQAMFHWLLVLLLNGRDCPQYVHHRYRLRIEDALLESVFHTSEDHHISIASLMEYCTFIASRQLVGLPSRVMGHLTFLFTHSLKELSNKPGMPGFLDALFRHFIEQDPLYVNPVYPMMQDDQSRTLTTLIKFAQSQQFHSSRLEELLSSWQVLVSSKLLGISMNSEIDPWNLQDALWMFEEYSCADPWDLRDVLWALEGQIPFGGSLDFKSLLCEINRDLSLQRGAIDLHDVTGLFQDVLDDPYPPADSPNPEPNEISTFEPSGELEAKLPDSSQKWCSIM